MLPGLIRPFLMRSDTDIFLPVGHAVHTGAVAGRHAQCWAGGGGTLAWCRNAAGLPGTLLGTVFNKALCTRVQAVVATSY